ncbi:MAG: Glutaminyl-tRNA synthetase [Bathelium mastoideum]|nr:MAG: Glutaminyl-tRNA synthetase [Bathelium mastoideum]
MTEPAKKDGTGDGGEVQKNGQVPKDESSRTTGGVAEASKKAAKKAAKKAEKAEKKLEHLATRPKEAAGKPKESKPKEDASADDPEAIFKEGFLKKVYAEKPRPVRTRFPPEPNGYLHIGHAKAICVNFGFAKHHNGICFLRYDDTNPQKEEERYFTSIQEMVRWLGFEPYQITYSSDHFDRLYELAEELIRRDKAYVCHCTKEEVNLGRGGKDNRGERFACVHRSRPVEESLTEFRAMKDGKYGPGEAHLRMKQDLNDGNPQMWDLAAFRVVKENHHYRTGDKWRIYPTYDFTHCLCDSFEEISHSLCTTEFILSRTSYDWLLEQLDFKSPGSEEKGPMQREYGRLNVEGTILSKRRIEKLVKGFKASTRTIPSVVRDWDDPRLYTLVAIRRRGVPPGALLRFVGELGVTTSETSIQVARFENSVRKYLERTVPRLMVILDPIKVIIDNLPEDHAEEFDAPFDPKNPDVGSHQIPLTRTIYIERDDFREEDDPNFFRLAPGKWVGLLYVNHPIKAESFVKDPSTGRVTEIKATYGSNNSPKPKARIHWVGGSALGKTVPAEARVFNSLFRTPNPNSLDWDDGGYYNDINPDSEIIYPNAIIESGFNEIRKRAPWPAEAGEAKVEGQEAAPYTIRFQGLRTGYFCVDRDSIDGKVVLNRIVTLKEDEGKKA